MAITTFTGDLSAQFPAGTSLEARPASNYPVEKRPPAPGTTPAGSATATASSSSAGVLSLTGLADNTEYFVSDAAGSKHVRITTFPERQEVMTNQADQANGYPKLDANAKVPWAMLAGSPANVLDKAYGGIADAVNTTGSITAASNQLTLTSGGFTAADVGKVVLVGGAGTTVNLGASNGGTAVPRPYKGWIASVAGGIATLVTAKGGSSASNAVTTQTDTAVTYGTNLYDALVLALATGRAVEVPAGDYICVGSLTGQLKRLVGVRRATRIYMSPEFTNFTPDYGTAGLTGSSKTLGSNAALGDTSVVLSSALSTISSGDVLFLSSTAVWESGGSDTDATATKKGEFVRVQQVAGTTVYLEAPLADSYLTADTAKVQAFTFADGVEVSGLNFVNATPNVYTYAASSPFTLSQYGGFGNILTLSRFKNIRIEGLELEGLSTAHILLTNCIDFDISRIKTRDSSRLGSFGYTVSLFACQWGEVTHCRSRRSSSLFNAEGVLSDSTGQANMPTRWVEVRDCVSYEGQHEPFLTHVTAEFIDFINCRVFGGAFYQVEANHSSGIRIFGRNCKLINPVVQNVAGTAIVIGGRNCELHNPIIRKVVANSLTSRGIDVAAGNPGAMGTLIRGADIDGVALDASNGEGHGIVIANGCTARIIGRNDLRNVDGYGVWDKDATEATIVDGLDGVSHGHASAVLTPHLIKHDGTGNTPVYRNVRLTSVRNAAVRATDKTGAMDNRYKKFTADGTIIIPDGVTKVRCRAIGAGGGGAGAGSAAGATLQAGGGGGAGGTIVETEIDVTPGETLTIDVGTGGAGGAGGAANNNTGADGGLGGNTTIANSTPTTLVTAFGGSRGRLSAGNTTTAGNGGGYGSLNNAVSGTTNPPGSGGAGSTQSTGVMVCVIGGGGGTAATATNGGGGGAAQLAGTVFAFSSAAGGSGPSGTSAGINGTTATMPGCGGGGGGGGAAGTGAGGNGGAGADGLVELWW